MPLIVFEGLDGSGKSTLMKKLESRLKKRGLSVFMSREPGGTPLAEELRQIILRKDGTEVPVPRTELLLYEACRAQHVETVLRPKLQAGTWVLCDRFTASSIAFQAGGRSIHEKDVEWLNDFATGGLPVQLTVLLDLSHDAAESRRQNRTQHTGETQDRMESEARDFHERVRQSFLKQARVATALNVSSKGSNKNLNWLVLDATKSVEYLDLELWDFIERQTWAGFSTEL